MPPPAEPGSLDDVDDGSDEEGAPAAGAWALPQQFVPAPKPGRRAALKVTIVAPGSRGDVQPLLAVAARLRDRGEAVTLATHRCFRADVGRLEGVRFACVAGDPRDHRGKSVAEDEKETAELARQQLADYECACLCADIVCFNWFGMAGYHIAEEMGVPCAALWLVPFSRSRSMECFMMASPKMEGLRGKLANTGLTELKYELQTHLLWEEMFWQPFSAHFNAWRQRMGLEPLTGGKTPFGEMFKKRVPIAYGFSNAVLPKPRDWPGHHLVCGYFTEEKWEEGGEGYTPPQDLVDFLAAGEPPVYLGFGSAVPGDPRGSAMTLLRACKEVGKRVVLLAGLGEGLVADRAALEIDGSLPDPDEVYLGDSFVPHGWLLPRCCVAVHHGGAGTTGACARAGVPTVVCPVEYDQYYWASRAHELGTAAPPLLPPEGVVEGGSGTRPPALEDAVAALRGALAPAAASAARRVARDVRRDEGAAVAAEFVSLFARQHWAKKRVHSCKVCESYH
eukprot:PRCOL_00000187-RA